MIESAQLTWIEGDAPYSKRFKDRYFSAHEGRAETRAVFLAGNDLPDRWQNVEHFHIAELGFGTGLNFLETLALWQKQAPTRAMLTYTSFELYPLSRDEMARALVRWPELEGQAAWLLAQWPLTDPLRSANVELQLITGDARQTVPHWQGRTDAWYLDGFSPAKNPQMWDTDLMRAVYENTRKGGTFSTYTAAGFVRRNLQEAGFLVQKVPGFGAKRERLQGCKS